jgi:hypothetical protein
MSVPRDVCFIHYSYGCKKWRPKLSSPFLTNLDFQLLGQDYCPLGQV